MTERQIRMQCGQSHPQLYRVPDGARVEWQSIVPWVIGKDGAPIRCTVTDCGSITHNGLPRAMRAVRIRATLRPNVPCDDRCMSATSTECRCACGGNNHGTEEVQG